MTTAAEPVAAAAGTPAPEPTKTPSNPLLDFSIEKLHEAYREQAYDRMSEQFLAVLDHLRNITYYALDIPTKHALNSFLKHACYFKFTTNSFMKCRWIW